MDIPKLRGLELQFRTRSRVIPTSEGKALAFNFDLGPLRFFCIVHMPDLQGENALTPLVYVKTSLADDWEEWEVFRNHG
jgi:hypothetical protein